MPLITAYHRPRHLDEALALLASPERVPLGGGTVLNADRAPSELELVDLQALGLDGIVSDGVRLRLGATATLADVAEHGSVPAQVRRLARAELPSTLRTLATVGGTVARRDSDSVVLAALLVHDAEVELAGADDLPLSVALVSGIPEGALITAVTIDPSGDGAEAVAARTPADTPIVAAIGRRAPDGIHLALTGAAARPVLVSPDAPTADLDPPSDFRGSSAYRLELAGVLAGRVVAQLT